MFNGVWSLALSAALSAGPPQYVAGHAQHGYAPLPDESYYDYAPAVEAGYEAAYPVTETGEQLYPYDAPEPWLHGYFQEIPAYGGYGAFRPYNYKHVLSQSQAAGGWGMPPVMPYSQQFWHRYHEQAAMKQHLTQIGASEYKAELARLRAGERFEAQQRYTASLHRPETMPAVQIGRPYAHMPPAPIAAHNFQPTITPAAHQHQAQLEAMRKRIEEQQAKLKALEQALEQRQSRQEAESRTLRSAIEQRFRR